MTRSNPFPTRRDALAGAGAGIGLFMIGRPALAQATKLRFAHPHPEADSWHKAALLLAEQIKTRSQGRYEVQVFPNGSLGSDAQTISAVRGGSLDICLTGNPFFTGLAPKLNVLDLPFLIQSRKHAAAVMDGPIGDGLRQELEGSNLKALATWEDITPLARNEWICWIESADRSPRCIEHGGY